jgi:hypothetical protein
MEEFRQSKRRGYIFSDKKFVCRKTSASLSRWLQNINTMKMISEYWNKIRELKKEKK